MKKTKDSKKALKIEKFEVARFENTSKIIGGDPPPDDHTFLTLSSNHCRGGS